MVGRQLPLRVRDEEASEESEYFLGLLFHNYILRRLVVFDLATEDFTSEFANKVNFHLAAVDELERRLGGRATIGLVLCRA